MQFVDIFLLDYQCMSDLAIKEYKIRMADTLIWLAARKLKRGTRFEVRLGFQYDFGNKQEIGFITNPVIQGNPDNFINLAEPLFIAEGGYYLMYRGEV